MTFFEKPAKRFSTRLLAAQLIFGAAALSMVPSLLKLDMPRMIPSHSQDEGKAPRSAKAMPVLTETDLSFSFPPNLIKNPKEIFLKSHDKCQSWFDIDRPNDPASFCKNKI